MADVHKPSRARRGAGALGALLVAGAALVALSPAARSAGRELVVTPAEGLANEVVTVTWSGFTPTTDGGANAVIVLQCKASPATLADCFTGDPFPAVAEGNRQLGRTAADGTGSLLLEVRPASQLPELGCSATSPCSVLAYENDGQAVPPGALPASAIVAPLAFAPSQADCPPVSSFDLRADGEASAAPLMYRWAGLRCTGEDPFVLDYTETSSNEGRENFLAGLVDVGVTSLPASEEEVAAHPERADHAYAPLDLTAVAVVINMKDPFTGRRIEDLVLTPRLVARLATDSDVTRLLNDPELRQLNPGVRLPTVALSHPLVRAERNADTRLVTSWFASDPAAQRFLAGEDDFGARLNSAYAGYTYPQDLFENVAQSAQFLPRAGQRNVALRMFYAVRPTGSASEPTDEIGFLGIVDLPTARRFGLPTARVVNAAGEAVAPDDEAILAGYRAMAEGPGSTLLADPLATDPEAYPLVKVDYAMVPDVPASAEQRQAVRDLLTYAVGDGQDVLPPGYVALPPDLREQTEAVIDALADEPVPEEPVPPLLGEEPLGEVDPGLFPEDPLLGTDGAVDDAGAGDGGGGEAAAGDGKDGEEEEEEGEDEGAAMAATGPTLPALPVSRSRFVAPSVLGVAGLALLAWSYGLVGGTARRWRVRRGRGA